MNKYTLGLGIIFYPNNYNLLLPIHSIQKLDGGGSGDKAVGNPLLDNDLVDAKILACVSRDRETENTRRTLMALERTRIKFPGKTDRDADVLMDRVRAFLTET